MPNASELITTPTLQTFKFSTSPVRKLDSESGCKFLEDIVQYVSTNLYTGILTHLPAYIRMFERQTPMHPEIGKGMATTYMGHVYSHDMPTVKAGDPLYEKVASMPRVLEEKDKYQIRIQAEAGEFAHQGKDKYITGELVANLINAIKSRAISANLLTISYIFTFFWMAVIMGDKPVIFDKAAFILLAKASTDATETGEKDLKEGQESMHKHLDEMKKRATKCKNRVYYDPAYIINGYQKEDNVVDVAEITKPNVGNTHESGVKAVYLDSNKKTPALTRGMCIYAMLKKIQLMIRRMTRPYLRYDTLIAHDPDTALTGNDRPIISFCTRDSLVLVVSDGDYDDLMNGGSIRGNSPTSLTLKDVIGDDIKVISLPGIAPGYFFLGQKDIFNYAVSLDRSHVTHHGHVQYLHFIHNKGLVLGCHTLNKLGVVGSPAKNFVPPAGFYEEFGKTD